MSVSKTERDTERGRERERDSPKRAHGPMGPKGPIWLMGPRGPKGPIGGTPANTCVYTCTSLYLYIHICGSFLFVLDIPALQRGRVTIGGPL